ncbi:MAG: type II secretion system F family protein [Candidatus Nanohaloarchaea archaeon]
MYTRNIKLKLKNYWRKHENLILMVAGAFVLGVTIAGLNYVNHQNTINKYESSVRKPINSSSAAEFNFTISRPSVSQSPKLNLEFENVDPENPVTIEVNGNEISESSSSSKLVKVPEDLVEKNNRVVIESTGLGIEQQALTYVKVKSKTSFQQLVFVLLNMVSLLLVAAPVMYLKYTEFQAKKDMEEKFPEFLRDVVEGTRAGMSLPQAIKNTETGSYGALDPKIEQMNAQLDWGIPFEKVLKNFSSQTGSPLIERSVDTIIQAYSSGGNIQDVLDSVGENIRTIRELKEKRESQLYGEMITGYIVFFIFIGILIALTQFLLPNLASAQDALGGSGSFSVLGGGGANLQENIRLYNKWFQRLVYIQAFFSGLIIGKLAEGELRAGFKHMAILFAAGYLAITFFL